MKSLPAELRIAVRALLKAPAFTATAIVTLGGAMMLCSMVLVVVKAYLFSALPYPEADRLHSILYAAPGQSGPRDMERLDWESLADVIEHPIAWDLDMFYVLGGENAEAVPGAWVTPGFVAGLGIRPALGRPFDDSAFQRGSGNVALISHRLWQSRFGGAPSALGAQFTAYVSDRPDEAERFTVVGVLPADFWHINPYTDILVPFTAPTYPYLARLREGVSAEQAASRITSLVRAGASKVPEGWTATVVPTHEQYVRRVRPVLNSILGAAALLLLVGCASVAGLQLVRASRRQREIAIRNALGAGAGAIARMLLIESTLLGGAAVVLGLAATQALIEVVGPLVQQQLVVSAPGGVPSFVIDWRVAAVAAAAGLSAAILSGLAPLGGAIRPGILSALQAGNLSTTESPRSRRARAVLIAVEIAASLTLLAASTLMLRTVVSLVQADLGIQDERILMTSTTLRQSAYPDAQSRLQLYGRMLTRLEQISGVESAALVSSWPMQQPQAVALEVPGSAAGGRAALHAVSDAYFATLGIPVIAGRAFNPTDRLGGEPVAIVSETLARRFWPDGRAVGGRLLVPGDSMSSAGQASSVERVVVGVVRDVRQDPGDVDHADVYVPFLQAPARFAFAVLQTRGDPATWLPALRAAFHDVDPELSLTRARPLAEAVAEMRARPQFLTSLLGAFAACAALVALVGVYGMIAYAVRQREREIAVRMAIGAPPAGVTRLFLREGAVVLGAGLLLGTAGAAAAGRLLESQLFGVGTRDPLSLAATLMAFGAAGLSAIWWPARRAAATDPAIALRVE